MSEAGDEKMTEAVAEEQEQVQAGADVPQGLSAEEFSQLQADHPEFKGDWTVLKRFCAAFVERRYRADLLSAWNAWRSEAQTVDLRGARLHRANLRDADLSGVDFEGAYLPESICERTRFQGANMTNCVLRGSDLNGAQFNETVIKGADLRFCRRATQAQLDRAVGDSQTQLPPQYSTPASWSS